MACSIEGSPSSARSAVSIHAANVATISDFGNPHRLRNTRSASNRTTRLTKRGLAFFDLTIDQSTYFLMLRSVVPDEVTNENVGVDSEHQRDSCSTGTRFLPFLYNSPARSATRLFFTRMSTTPSGLNVKLILSPVFIPRLSRIDLGIVAWPLLLTVASVLMVDSGILAVPSIVSSALSGKRPGTGVAIAESR